MGWKIFFWILVVATYPGLIFEIQQGHVIYLGDIIGNINGLFWPIAVGSYAYKKIVFPQIFWKIFLIWIAVYVIFTSLFPKMLQSYLQANQIQPLTIIIVLPILGGCIYTAAQLGFNSKIYKKQHFKKLKIFNF